MASNKTTILDIAHALGMSRNTVSKALKGGDGVSDKTIELIINKAREMGYKGHMEPLPPSSPIPAKGSIVFLTGNFSAHALFWPAVVKGVEGTVSQSGFQFTIKLVREEELANGSFPSHLNREDVVGIICTELYDRRYIDQLTATGIPLVMIDSVFDVFNEALPYDLLLMENQHSIHRLVSLLLEKGHERIGFAGKPDHCRSFYERYMGFKLAFFTSGELPPTAYSILPETDNYAVERLMGKLQEMPEFPTALVCANDHIALNVIKAARNLGLRVPEDLSVTGFDDISLATLVEPNLTTVNIHRVSLGKRAAELLLWRISHPDRPYETTYLENTIQLRNSIHGR
ncbi:LacI family DNA-binding transcriptional regulator [Anaerotalea alkaliphila]|uniref:LacI family transcriptional regulator n=1 Tax=Anaerotalea alkaliphila TaxID=2662126 RepID=A0A7X5HV98_9FIRM|nr:LacI family DNA-binding transcriptional regulator [Anaerotalea alkaliphila]NDL67285.1 LacI family transcriptional regulator [Anaerotalea alkaliphila]